MQGARLRTIAFSHRRLLFTLALSSLVSCLLLLIRATSNDSVNYVFLPWNLFLAWLPLVFAMWLRLRLAKSGWLTWQNIGISMLWLAFLPNSFYLVSDLVHLSGYRDDALGIFGGYGAASAASKNLLFDVVVLVSFIWNGLLLGFISLYLVHQDLLKRLSRKEAHGFIAVILLLCSFAIYLGRNLRWNTWDILLSPFGLIFDVSDRIINPAAHPQAFATTATFFVLFSSMYLVLLQLVAVIRSSKQ